MRGTSAGEPPVANGGRTHARSLRRNFPNHSVHLGACMRTRNDTLTHSDQFRVERPVSRRRRGHSRSHPQGVSKRHRQRVIRTTSCVQGQILTVCVTAFRHDKCALHRHLLDGTKLAVEAVGPTPAKHVWKQHSCVHLQSFSGITKYSGMQITYSATSLTIVLTNACLAQSFIAYVQHGWTLSMGLSAFHLL